MKAFLLLSLLSFSAMAAEFDCNYFQNLSEIHRSTATVIGKDVKIASLGEFDFFMSQLSGGKYELQVLNNYEPSRTYAASVLSASNPTLELTIWKREAIIEVHCTLKAN